MKIGKSETDNVYVCYCMLREMHPGKHQTERLQKVTEALWDAQAFYEKMEALMFGQAFVYGSREVVVRPFTEIEIIYGIAVPTVMVSISNPCICHGINQVRFYKSHIGAMISM